jgi:hypothetical protein
MGNSGIESKTNYLDGVFPYSDYLLLRDAFTALYPLEDLVGLCITPIKAMPTPTTFFSTGIKVMLVRYVSGPSVEEINFLDVDQITESASASRSPAPAPVASIAQLQAAAKKAVSPLTPIDWWNDTLYYHKTNEFEYCFIDRDTFEYLASDENMEFYKHDGTNYKDKEGNNVIPADRGIHFSRAFMTLEVGDRIYDDFRTLKFRPHPEPALVEYDSRPSVAYYLGPPCPPFWTHDGTSAESEIAVASMAMTARQSIEHPPKDGCTCNKINTRLLHQALKKQGIIPEDLGPAYRNNLTPIVVTTAISFLLLVSAVILQYSGKNVEADKSFVRNMANVGATAGLAFIGYVLFQLYRRIVQKNR